MRYRSLLLGGLTFAAAHVVEVVMWTSWFGGAWQPYFMNSGQAVAFTFGCVLVAGLLAGLAAKDRHEALVHAGNVAAGAIVAMTVVLILGLRDGNLVPISLVLGAHLLAIGSFAGTLLAFPFKAKTVGSGDAR